MDVAIKRVSRGDGGLLARVAPDVFDDDIDPALLAAYLADPSHLLVVAVVGGEVVGQWLRFLIAEFLGDRHRVDGWLDVPVPLERAAAVSTVLIVEAGEVFEGEVGDVS